MSYIYFDKKQLVNLEYSLGKEILRTNRAGSYASTTIVRCNTRKYHGLLVSTQPQIDNQHHVFLSTLDVTLIQKDAEFNLGIHKYADNLFEPGGHKYLRDFVGDPIPKLSYRVGEALLSSDMVFSQNDDRILVRYTLEEAPAEIRLRFNPLLAFRNIHFLNKKNDQVNTSYNNIKNGISLKMYEDYDMLHLQFSKKVDFHPFPDWYYNIEYPKEKTRGYDFNEDLYSPGTFELKLKPGESVVFSAGLRAIGQKKLPLLFDHEVDKRTPRDSFIHCLQNSAEQFFVYQKEEQAELFAGFPWFTMHARDTFLALPGLTLPQRNSELFLRVVDNMVDKMQDEFFPDSSAKGVYTYQSVDAPLWFFWALQKYVECFDDRALIWDKYGTVMSGILNGFARGTRFNIFMNSDGLLMAGSHTDVLTWMNTTVNEKPVINRNGLAVEVNALWYNAIKFYLSLENDKEALITWKAVSDRIEYTFLNTFWDETKGYLADVVRDGQRDFAVRPNQLIAASLPFSVLSDEIKYLVVHKVEQELLTPRGLRTLSPKNPDYKPIYKGDILTRNIAYHQGSVFPWLLGHFAEAYLKLHKHSGLSKIKRLFQGFEDEMTEVGIGTVSELFYGNPPHKGKGAISQAWSIAELLRMNEMIKKMESKTDQSI